MSDSLRYSILLSAFDGVNDLSLYLKQYTRVYGVQILLSPKSRLPDLTGQPAHTSAPIQTYGG